MALILGSTLYVAVTTAGNAKETGVVTTTSGNVASMSEYPTPINNEEALLEEADDRDSLLPMTSRDVDRASHGGPTGTNSHVVQHLPLPSERQDRT